MPFNATTYRMNKYRQEAKDHLAKARDVKARAAKGDAYDWEVARIPTIVTLARQSMHLFLSTRRIREIEKEEARLRRS